MAPCGPFLLESPHVASCTDRDLTRPRQTNLLGWSVRSGRTLSSVSQPCRWGLTSCTKLRLESGTKPCPFDLVSRPILLELIGATSVSRNLAGLPDLAPLKTVFIVTFNVKRQARRGSCGGIAGTAPLAVAFLTGMRLDNPIWTRDAASSLAAIEPTRLSLSTELRAPGLS